MPSSKLDHGTMKIREERRNGLGKPGGGKAIPTQSDTEPALFCCPAQQ